MKIGELITANYGKSLVETERKKGPVPVYSSSGLTGWHNSAINKSEAIIIGRKGNVGAVYYTPGPFFCIDTAYYVLPNDKVNFRYLYYNLVYQKLGNMNDGSPVPGLKRELLYDRNIYLPDEAVQQCIASILTSYDELIENNHKQIKLLEEAAMRLYKEWFINLRFPGHETANIIDGVPEGWTLSKTKGFMKFKYGKALKAEDRKLGEYPVYGSSGVVGYHNDYLVDGPVIIVGRKGNVGTVYLSHANAYPIDTVYYIESDISILYAYFSLRTRAFNNNDSAVPGLNRDYAESMDMMCPNKDLLNKFDGKASILLELQNKLLNQIDLLKQARDALLPKLMRGEIEINPTRGESI